MDELVSDLVIGEDFASFDAARNEVLYEMRAINEGRSCMEEVWQRRECFQDLKKAP